MEQQKTICDFSNSDSWVILSPIEQSIKRKKIESVGTPLKDWVFRSTARRVVELFYQFELTATLDAAPFRIGHVAAFVNNHAATAKDYFFA